LKFTYFYVVFIKHLQGNFEEAKFNTSILHFFMVFRGKELASRLDESLRVIDYAAFREF
jgi:hypothetical protein